MNERMGSLAPQREPVTYPVVVWFEIAYQLHKLGDGALAHAIHRAMDGRRLNDDVAFDLTADERERVATAVAQVRGERW
jgi:hypothetical protein